MKRHGNLWEKICNLDNLKLAHKNARRGKSFYAEVKMVDADIDKYCREIQKSLVNQTFKTSPYVVEERHDGRKMRTIHKLPYYPDRIVQHALLNVTSDLFVKTYIRDTFQSIVGRGTHDAMRRVKKLIRSPKCPKYALKIDIEKYYPSIQNQTMKQVVRRVIKCESTLWLIDDVIDSTKGLPIGNYTSQHFGNIYLNSIDWRVKQELKPKAYFRYCDDIVFMDNAKSRLLAIKVRVCSWLDRIGLRIKPSWNIYNIEKQGVDFVGFVFTPYNTRLRKSIATKFKAACKKLSKKIQDPVRDLSRIMAYKGWAQACNGKRLWRKHTMCLRKVFPKQLRGAI
jgi:RNA-directed DNA polymerase